MPTIDQYSVATVPIEMFFENTNLAIGTGFVWEAGGEFFLGGGAVATRFVGIYSGRLATDDPTDVQLGLAWPSQLISDIISGQKRDS